MNPYEEELQKNIEAGHTPEDNELDVKAYQDIFRALKKDPGYKLPVNFADRVVDRILAKQGSGFSKDYFWYAAGILFLAISFLATIIFTGFRLDFGFLKLDFGFLNMMSDYKGLVIFGIVFIILLNWVDKRLVKGRQVQH